jgi:hypothetical protein
VIGTFKGNGMDIEIKRQNTVRRMPASSLAPLDRKGPPKSDPWATSGRERILRRTRQAESPLLASGSIVDHETNTV